MSELLALPRSPLVQEEDSYYRKASFTAYGAHWTMDYDALFRTAKGSFELTG